MARQVTLVLLDGDGRVLGALPPFPVTSPHRQEVTEVVDGARARHGVSVVVLRLLHAAGPEVSYLAELVCGTPAGVTPVALDTSAHPLRAPYAVPGGPAAGLAWAWQALGCAPGPATQVRTWNLSSVWTLYPPGGPVWLKEVPAFLGHEPALLCWLARRCPGLAPTPLATAAGRMLLPDVPGSDRYLAPAADRLAMLARLHQAQLAAREHLDELLALGVPDGRRPVLAGLLAATAHRFGRPELADGVADRLAALAGCGVPDTLVHGDFHPGNVRGETVLDWPDSHLGNPAVDLLRMTQGLPGEEAAGLVAAWCDWWRAAVPGSRPERAVQLLAPLSALRYAAVNATFLDAIEPAERVYHADDVHYWLAVAAGEDPAQ
jgi:hypothetical protein